MSRNLTRIVSIVLVAASPLACAASEPARTKNELAWPAELQEGRRAWISQAVRLAPTPAGPGGETVPAGTEARLDSSDKRRDGVWWRIECVSPDESGWVPEAALTRDWPKTPADALPPMLGDRSREIAELRAQIEGGDFRARVRALKQLHMSGITDEDLYDAIAARLLVGLARTEDAKSAIWIHVGKAISGLVGGLIVAAATTETNMTFDSKEWVQEVAWLTKGLGYSGYTKYRPLLERAAETDSLGTGSISRHANDALDGLETHSRWNRIINEPAGHPKDRSWQAKHAVNLLRSGERTLQRTGLNRIIALKQPALFDEVQEQLLRTYKEPMDDDQEDTAALMAKTLGRSRDPRYRAALGEVAANASAEDVREMAAEMIEAMDATGE